VRRWNQPTWVLEAHQKRRRRRVARLHYSCGWERRYYRGACPGRWAEALYRL